MNKQTRNHEKSSERKRRTEVRGRMDRFPSRVWVHLSHCHHLVTADLYKDAESLDIAEVTLITFSKLGAERRRLDFFAIL